jgi:hypothetical protein
MASAQHPNRVYFTSLDRSPVDPNTDFTITFDTPIENSKNFEVVSAAFPNTFHQFAGYETILYFYHELFQGGSIAIGVPLSITPFLQEGKTGEAVLPSARPVGREQYIDKRYFLDGDDLATYLNNWIASLSATGGTNFPAASTGLCPFFFANDDPSQPATFFADEAATSVDFSKLSFTYDNTTALGGTGSLKLVFADSDAHDVRVASIVDFGYLNSDNYYPSLLGYKLGYTDLQYEAFGDVVNITSANNQFSLYLNLGADSFVIDNTTDQFFISIGSALTFSIPHGVYTTASDLVAALNNATGAIPVVFTLVGGNTITITLPSPGAFSPPNGTPIGLAATPAFGTMTGLGTSITLGTFGTTPFPITSSPGSPVVPNGPADIYSGTYTIPPNDYTSTALAAAIQDCLRTQNTGTPLYTYVGSTTTVAQASDILSFTFTSSLTGRDVDLVFNASDAVQTACGTTLGFVNSGNTSSTGSTLTAPNAVVFQSPISPADHLASDPINLIRTSNIYFASSLSAGEALSSAGRKDVLFSVPLTAPVGSVQLYQSTLSGVIVNRPPSVVRNLRVSLLDDNFQIMEAMPQNSSISVEIHFSYDDENNTNNVSTNPYAQKA